MADIVWKWIGGDWEVYCGSYSDFQAERQLRRQPTLAGKFTAAQVQAATGIAVGSPDEFWLYEHDAAGIGGTDKGIELYVRSSKAVS